jgi:hypothetical protein
MVIGDGLEMRHEPERNLSMLRGKEAMAYGRFLVPILRANW